MVYRFFTALILILPFVNGMGQTGCDQRYGKWTREAEEVSTAAARKTCLSECDVKEYPAIFFMAYSYYLDEEPDSALLFIDQIGKKYPSDSLYFLEALVRRIWDDSSETAKAGKCLLKAIELDKENPYYLSTYAEVLLELEHPFEEALSYFDMAIKADPEYVPAWLGKAGVQMAQEKRDEGTLSVQKAISLEPDNPAVYFYAARVMQQGDLWKQGMQYLDTALLLDSSYVEVFIEKAGMYLEVDEPIPAIEQYDLALEFDSTATDVYLMRGDALLDIKEYDLAIKDYKTYMRYHPRAPEAISGLADSYYDRGMFDSALVQYQMLPPGADADPEIAFGKAECYAELGNFEEAFKLYGSILRKEPKNTQVYLERAALYMQQKKYYEAERDYKMALKIDPTDVEVFYLHCQAAWYAGYERDACESCKQAIFYGVKDVDKKYMKSCGN